MFDWKLEWKPADMWVGVFWRRTHCTDANGNTAPLCTEAWICLLPCLPIHVTYWHMAKLR